MMEFSIKIKYLDLMKEFEDFLAIDIRFSLFIHPSWSTIPIYQETLKCKNSTIIREIPDSRAQKYFEALY